MAKIRVLPEILANQIAAGEIVERPASVAKELLENSLDAGAGAIQLDAVQGGKRLIRLRDDGEGMDRDDVLLAFEHHATSKIAGPGDLQAIRTLGFRGEALPSIASVSRLTLRSIVAGREEPGIAHCGTEVRIHGGITKSVKEISWSRGTEITVEDLFYNLPARKKFLRTDETEFQNLSRLALQYAMCLPQVAFLFRHNDRICFDYPATELHQERIYQILGKDLTANLVAFHRRQDGYEVFGFAGKPNEQRKHPYSQYYYVNNRMVRDRLLSRAVIESYESSLTHGSYPVIVLFLSAPFEEVDVNVHPAKTEVRFREPEKVRTLIRSALQEAFQRYLPVSRFYYEETYKRKETLDPPDGKETVIRMEPLFPMAQRFSEGMDPMVVPGEKGETFIAAGKPVHSGPVSVQETAEDFQSGFPAETGTRDFPLEGREEEEPICRLTVASEEELHRRMLQERLDRPSAWRAIGQYADTYILAADVEGLLLLDQHVVHERILFERTLAKIAQGGITRHGLLFPITLELTALERGVFDRAHEALESAGFEVEGFGGATIVIKAVPSILSDKDSRRLIREILDVVGSDLQRGEGMTLDDFRRRIAAAIACKAAVKANTPLTIPEMQSLLEELRRTRFPHACPHGRPIQLRLSLKEIEKRFQRI